MDPTSARFVIIIGYGAACKNCMQMAKCDKLFKIGSKLESMPIGMGPLGSLTHGSGNRGAGPQRHLRHWTSRIHSQPESRQRALHSSFLQLATRECSLMSLATLL